MIRTRYIFAGLAAVVLSVGLWGIADRDEGKKKEKDSSEAVKNGQKDNVKLEALTEQALNASATEQSTEEVGPPKKTNNRWKKLAGVLAATLAASSVDRTNAFAVGNNPAIPPNVAVGNNVDRTLQAFAVGNNLARDRNVFGVGAGGTALRSGLVNGRTINVGKFGSNTPFGPHEYPALGNISKTTWRPAAVQKLLSHIEGDIEIIDRDGTEPKDWNDNADFYIKHPNSEADTALYLWTSKAGDAAGAFAMDSIVVSGLAELAAGFNVAFKRVGDVEDMKDYLERNRDKFGTVRYVVLGGHGHEKGLQLGMDQLEVGSPALSALAHSLRPLLSQDATNPSTVVLHSCLTGSNTEALVKAFPNCNECNFAMGLCMALNEPTRVTRVSPRVSPGTRVFCYDREVGRLQIGEDAVTRRDGSITLGPLKPTAHIPGTPDFEKMENIHPWELVFNPDTGFTAKQSFLETEHDVEILYAAMREKCSYTNPRTREDCSKAMLKKNFAYIFVYGATASPFLPDSSADLRKGTCIQFPDLASLELFRTTGNCIPLPTSGLPQKKGKNRSSKKMKKEAHKKKKGQNRGGKKKGQKKKGQKKKRSKKD